jgi:drug/metabolite transporter (DMT)-like permease
VSAARSRFLLFAAAFLFSTGGAAIKGCHLASWQIASFRSGVAALTVALLLPESRRIWHPRILLLGVAYAATVAFFVLATKLTTSAQAIFLQSTAPLYLLFLGPLVLHERLRRSQLLMVALVAVGAILLLFGEQRASRTAPNPVAGKWLGALCGLTWAITMTGFRWLTKGSSKNGVDTDSPAAVVVAGNIIACLACLPMALPVSHAAPADGVVILYLGIFQIGLAYMAVTRSVRRVPALEATTLLLLEPVFNPVWTWLFYGETLTPATLAGGALILCATFGSTLYQSQQSSPAT